MDIGRSVEQRRGFLETAASYLNVVQFIPEGTPAAAVLFVPPFGEEMNHSRRVMAEAGRRLARKGIETSVVDLTGTGESSGRLADVDLARWIDDIGVVCSALTRQPYAVVGVVGIRFGALLAAVALRRLAFDLPLIMWQPVASGADHLREMAAQRAIADRLRGDAGAPSTADVMNWLLKGRNVELGGYQIGSKLGNDVFHLELPGPEGGHAGHHWFEIRCNSKTATGSRLQTTSSVRADWAARVTCVHADPFWSLPDCPLPTQLFDATENVILV